MLVKKCKELFNVYSDANFKLIEIESKVGSVSLANQFRQNRNALKKELGALITISNGFLSSNLSNVSSSTLHSVDVIEDESRETIEQFQPFDTSSPVPFSSVGYNDIGRESIGLNLESKSGPSFMGTSEYVTVDNLLGDFNQVVSISNDHKVQSTITSGVPELVSTSYQVRSKNEGKEFGVRFSEFSAVTSSGEKGVEQEPAVSTSSPLVLGAHHPSIVGSSRVTTVPLIVPPPSTSEFFSLTSENRKDKLTFTSPSDGRSSWDYTTAPGGRRTFAPVSESLPPKSEYISSRSDLSLIHI